MENRDLRRAELTHIAEVMEDLHPKSTQPVRLPTRPESIYECSICQDARFIHPLQEDGKPDYSRIVACACSVERNLMLRHQAMLRMCELPVGTEHMTFENFVVRPGLEEAYAAAVDVAEGSAKGWLTLVCDVNRGKTHLLIATCRQWFSRDEPARYAYVPILLEELRRGFREEGDRSFDRRFDFFLNVPLLALDDLGTEHKTDWVREKLDTIIDYRLMHNLVTVVNANVPLEELNFRIRSRLERGGKIVFIDAPEYMEANSED